MARVFPTQDHELLKRVKEETDRTGSVLKVALHLGLDCGLSYISSIHGNDIPTGKPRPQKEEPQGSYLDSL